MSLYDGGDDFSNFLSNPYESNGQTESTVDHLKQYENGDEFLPSQLLSDLLYGSAEPIKVSR